MILVTGASGYVGNNLVRRLVQLGKPVRAMVGSVNKALERLKDVETKVEIVKGDVTRPETLAEWMEGVDTVIHLVAIAIEKGKNTYEAINYQGTVNIVEAAKRAGVRRFINMCQNGAYADVKSPFLRSKGRAQEYVAKSGLDWSAVRPSVIWGPQDEFANVQARLIKMTPFIFPIVGDGKAQFQPVYVGDVVEAIVKCLDDEATIGAEFELGGAEVLTYSDIVERVLKALGTRRARVKLPVGLLRPAVALMQVILPKPPVSTTLLDLLAVPNVCKENALETRLGITPKPFTPENLAYMRQFNTLTTLRKFFGKNTEESTVIRAAMGN
ncbi:MAG TPA: complex I NDUFA9 subunit family protein [Aggregatilineales bacterium]|nr:complex I NDUFA9 subunit family protein [Anaerolineales bacterium]HRE46239.1 complex I NDUFA9 subunit family protein [Aggregatilineales bacterium]